MCWCVVPHEGSTGVIVMLGYTRGDTGEAMGNVSEECRKEIRVGIDLIEFNMLFDNTFFLFFYVFA